MWGKKEVKQKKIFLDIEFYQEESQPWRAVSVVYEDLTKFDYILQQIDDFLNMDVLEIRIEEDYFYFVRPDNWSIFKVTCEIREEENSMDTDKVVAF